MNDRLKSLEFRIKTDPNKAEHHLNYGLELFECNRTEEAVLSYKKAISLDANLGAAHINLGLALSYLDKDQDAIDAFQIGLELIPDHIDGLFGLARCQRAEELYEEAAITFKKALALAPTRTKAYWELGYSLELSGDKIGGQKAYETCLKHHPNHSVAGHLRDALIGNTTNAAPPDYIEELFDDYASTFDEFLINELDYAVPKLIRSTLEKLNLTTPIQLVLDLGGGTGLVAKELRKFIKENSSIIHGVDLSSGMLEIAKQHNCYDKTFIVGIEDFLNDHQSGLPRYDLITAGDVFVYIGDLQNIYRDAYGRLNSNGLFLFTVEQSMDEKFILQSSARYAHSEAYLKELATNTNFKILYFEEMIPRKESDENINGYLICLQK